MKRFAAMLAMMTSLFTAGYGVAFAWPGWAIAVLAAASIVSGTWFETVVENETRRDAQTVTDWIQVAQFFDQLNDIYKPPVWPVVMKRSVFGGGTVEELLEAGDFATLRTWTDRLAGGPRKGETQ